MKLIERIKAPTPKFFKKVRRAGIWLATIGGALVASPVALPGLIVTIGGYLVTGGAALSAISQVTVDQGQK